MTAKLLTDNARCLEREIGWFQELLELRFEYHTQQEKTRAPLLETLPPPTLDGCLSPYTSVVRKFEMDAAERLVLLLALLPHIKPDLLDPFFIHNQSMQRRFTEFGGQTGATHTGFLPTGETALFLLAGDNLALRLRYHPLFSPRHFFYAQHILRLNEQHSGEPALSAVLSLTPEYIERLTTGEDFQPAYSAEFPAHLLGTAYDWDDLVLDAVVEEEVGEIIAWIRHRDLLMNQWALGKRLKPGYRSLFYGPPGTGKTLTATLLGKITGLPVYRIDLSQVVSKYIGETEKNLAHLFDSAERQNWILFFDEADALFGKRTEASTANDRAANQQTSYLLQRIEDFPGVVILASNLRSNIDEAFARRFQSMIHFPLPDVAQRQRLWEDNFLSRHYRLASDVNLTKLAREYELSGASIVNVLRSACLKAAQRSPPEICLQDLLHGVRRELHKEGKFLK